jgi:hypothetical protein
LFELRSTLRAPRALPAYLGAKRNEKHAPSSAAAEMMVCRAQDFRGWRLHVRCGQSRNYTIIPVADLSDRMQGLTVTKLLRRLRCQRCGLRVAGTEFCAAAAPHAGRMAGR